MHTGRSAPPTFHGLLGCPEVAGDRQGRAGSWDWLARQAALHPERPYWESRAARLSVGALDERVDHVVGWLWAAGVRPGDRVSVLLPPDYQHVELLFAAIRMGVVLVPQNPRLTPAELAVRLDAVAPRLVVAAPDVALPAGWPGRVVAAARPEADALVLTPARRVDYEPSADSVQSLIFTSGTSGEAKAAVLTLRQHWWAALGSQLRLGHQPDDVWLLTLPLFHVGGQAILLRAVITGMPVVALPKFDPDQVGRHLSDGSVTLASLVPTMLQRVLAAQRGAFSPRLRAVLIGGGRAEPAWLARAWEAGLPALPTYGMTETASQAATLDRSEAPEGLATSGRPLWGVEFAVLNPGGDGVGDIAVRGPQVMTHYWQQEPWSSAGEWFRTGDMGYLDRAGRLVVVDRRTDLIVSGGENIYPAEVERVLDGYPDVDQVAVVGAADADWGQVVVAFVVLRPGASWDPAALLGYAAEHLARYKLPRRWVQVPALPLTANGKVWRDRLRAWAEERP